MPNSIKPGPAYRNPVSQNPADRHPVNKAAVLRDLQLKIQAMETGLAARARPPDELMKEGRAPGRNVDHSPSQRVNNGAQSASDTQAKTDTGDWTLGVPQIEALLPGARLQPGGIHEVKPMKEGDWLCNHVAAFGFLLRLLRRRLLALHNEVEVEQRAGEIISRSNLSGSRRIKKTDKDRRQYPHAPVLLCWSPRLELELGNLYGPGLQGLGFDLSSVIIAAPQTIQDQLWVMEEGLNSGALAGVVGLIDDVGLTPARRLSLSARAHGTPCLLLTHPHKPAIGPALTRWRIGPAASVRSNNMASKSALTKSAHVQNGIAQNTPCEMVRQTPAPTPAPIRVRFALRLERCRYGVRLRSGGSIGPDNTPGQTHNIVEWSDEANCFHLATGLANRASDTPVQKERGAGRHHGQDDPYSARAPVCTGRANRSRPDDYSNKCARAS